MKEDASGSVPVKRRIKELSNAGLLINTACRHLDSIKDVVPSANGCEDCLKMGDTWVYLRLCLECGYVGCCDNSKNKHATSHHHETQHPMIVSYEEGEEWFWCYVDELMFDL